MEDILRQAIERVLKDNNVPTVSFSIDHPKDLSHGDYATNVALVAAKQAGQNPQTLAATIAESLLDAGILGVRSATVAGPGFINITLARSFFSEKLNDIHTQGEAWGTHTTYQGKKVMVEYTDPNPFKELHIGHVMTNAIGESISRLVAAGGATVRRANYQGDVGLHVAKALYGMQALALSGSELTPADLGKAYARGATAYEEDERAKMEIVALNKKIYERSDEAVNQLYDKGRAVSLAYFEEMYQVLGTTFDHYFFESEAGPLGKQLVLDNPSVFVESDGAHVFKGEEYGLHTRVFLNKEGLPTYEAKELGLAKTKYDAFPYDHSIIVTANEITEYFKVLKKAMEFVYPDLAAKTEHIGHGLLKLTTGKMSSRTGDIVSAHAFISELAQSAKEKMAGREISDRERVSEQVAVAAFKYSVLKGSIRQDVVFDKEQSLSFEGASGPYLQYTAVRAGTVLKKAEDAGIRKDLGAAPDEPYLLERMVYQFPEVVVRAAEEREPHHVATYLTELAAAFNSFYATERIADTSDPHAPYKVALTEGVRTTLVNGLDLLGIQVPEKM